VQLLAHTESPTIKIRGISVAVRPGPCIGARSWWWSTGVVVVGQAMHWVPSLHSQHKEQSEQGLPLAKHIQAYLQVPAEEPELEPQQMPLLQEPPPPPIHEHPMSQGYSLTRSCGAPTGSTTATLPTHSPSLMQVPAQYVKHQWTSWRTPGGGPQEAQPQHCPPQPSLMQVPRNT